MDVYLENNEKKKEGIDELMREEEELMGKN